MEQIREWQQQHPLSYASSDSEIKPQFLVEKIYELTKGKNSIIVTGVGQHQMWVAQYYKFHSPRTFLTSGGLGTMGYGFPSGIGAKVAFPHKDVIVVDGDGSIQMNIQKMSTVAHNKIPVKVAILNIKGKPRVKRARSSVTVS
jgi:acetolactate synthase-1/2/3 large subunit